MVNAFSDLVDNPPHLEKPFVCNLVEFISYDEENEHSICTIEDDFGNKIIGFLYKKFAKIVSEPVVLSRLPFKITVIKGKMVDLGGNLSFEIYQTVFDKNFLINSSILSSHSWCPMQTYLRNYIRVESDLNVNLLYGVLLHDYLSIVFSDASLLEMNPEDEKLGNIVKRAFKKAIYNNWRLLCAIGVDENMAFNAFMNTTYQEELQFVKYEIDRLTATEDEYAFQNEKMIRSKDFGLQGRIDRLIWNKSKKLFTIIETKTGKSSSSNTSTAKHQLISYSIILREYFTEELEELILEYPRNQLIERFQIIDYEEDIFYKIISMRNDIWTINVGKRPELGPFLHCSKCWSKDICSFYCLRSFLTEHCSSCEQCKYLTILKDEERFQRFQRFNAYYDWFFQFLEGEYLANLSLRSEINLNAEERENLGNCVSNLIIRDIETRTDAETTIIKIERTFILLTKDPNMKDAKNVSNISNTRLNKGDYILLTPQDYKPLTVESYPATLKSINGNEVRIVLKNEFSQEIQEYPSGTLFRIDMASSNINLNLERSALDKFLRLPYKSGKEQFLKLRNRLLNIPEMSQRERIDKGSEKEANNDFEPDTQDDLGLKSVIKLVKQELLDLKYNQDQIDAILHVLEMEGLQLIHGPPGTGKTTVIAEIVYQIHSKIDESEKYGYPNNEIGINPLRYDKEDKTKDPTLVNFDFDISVMHKKILICAYTNRAVDNIIEKLGNMHPDINIVRIGSLYSISPNALKYSLQVKAQKTIGLTDGNLETVISPMQAQKCIDEADVIAATCLGANNQVLKNVEFSYILIDEAGQVIEPAALIPITKGENILLIGDDQQLPPISQEMEDIEFDDSFFVDKAYLRDFKQKNDILAANQLTNKERRKKFYSILKKIKLNKEDTLSTSIFQRLKRIYQGTSRYFSLKHQYRMNRIISDFSSKWWYDHKIVPGKTEEIDVGQRTLVDFFDEIEIPFYSTCKRFFGDLETICFDPEKPMIFLDTRTIDAFDSNEDERFEGMHSKFNEKEAKIIARILIEYFAVINNAISKEQADYLSQFKRIIENIGVITPYRAQVRAIHNAIFKNLAMSQDIMNLLLEHLSIDTVDKFQGRESEIIIISLVDSNIDHVLSELHNEIRRLNVSITRAKTKLIVAGNSEMFKKSPPNSDKIKNGKKNFPKKHGDLLDFIKQAEENTRSEPIYHILSDLVDYTFLNGGYLKLTKDVLNWL
ncbi:MAG: AAA family ATPase [Candidatus Lokiarchaeota archaeon]|nr:AAA family ATPase [Candidatus Lokiarchaeota archaeon]